MSVFLAKRPILWYEIGMSITKLPMPRPLSLAIGAWFGVAPLCLAQTPGFHALGSAPGTTYSVATALSADGRRAAGYSGTGTGFLWTDTSGRYDFGTEPGVLGSTASALSGDGTAVVGQAGGNEAFRWVGPGTYQRLGTFGGYPISKATSVSDGGAVVVGYAYNTQAAVSQAFRWTAATGMVGLGYTGPTHAHSEARGISRDGNTIVGWSRDFLTGNADPFAWTQSGGMRVLPLLPGRNTGGAYAVSADGSFIVGGDSVGAVIWTPTGVQELTPPAGWYRSGADHVSDDGQVVLGSLLSTTQAVDAVWTPSTGFVPFLDYLALNGISVPAGYTIRDVNAMSGDGRTFCGSLFMDATSPAQAFVVTVPAPGSLAGVGFGALMAARRRR